MLIFNQIHNSKTNDLSFKLMIRNKKVEISR